MKEKFRTSCSEEQEIYPDIAPTVSQIEHTHIQGNHYNTIDYFKTLWKYHFKNTDDIKNLSFLTPQQAISLDIEYFKYILDNNKVVVDNSSEAETTTFHRLFYVLKHKGANLNNLYLLSGGFEIVQDNSVKFCKEYFGVNIIHWPFWLVNEINTIKNGGRPHNIKLQNPVFTNIRHKKFVCLNNFFKKFRLELLLNLFKNNLLNQGYVSARWSFDPESIFYENITGDTNIGDFFKKVKTEYQIEQEFKDIFPLLLDTNKIQDFKDRKMNSEWILNSMINLVSESFCDDNFINNCDILKQFGYNKHTQEIGFVTEKTVKPIGYGQPFLIVGSPYTTQYLKHLGFATYENLFPRYDNSLNISERIHTVVQYLKEFDHNQYDSETLDQIHQNRNLLLGNQFAKTQLQDVLDKINS